MAINEPKKTKERQRERERERERGRGGEKLEIEEERVWKGIGRLVAANLRTIETRPRHDRYRYNKCQVEDSEIKKEKKKKKEKKTVRADPSGRTEND